MKRLLSKHKFVAIVLTVGLIGTTAGASVIYDTSKPLEEPKAEVVAIKPVEKEATPEAEPEKATKKAVEVTQSAPEQPQTAKTEHAEEEPKERTSTEIADAGIALARRPEHSRAKETRLCLIEYINTFPNIKELDEDVANRRVAGTYVAMLSNPSSMVNSSGIDCVKYMK